MITIDSMSTALNIMAPKMIPIIMTLLLRLFPASEVLDDSIIAGGQLGESAKYIHVDQFNIYKTCNFSSV